MQVVCKVPNTYPKLKTKLKKTTLVYGAGISTSILVAKGIEPGVSASLGFLSSYGYLYLLQRYVDNFETSTQKQLLIPLATALFEKTWNMGHDFQFDYGYTLIGFLAYKFALTSLLFETIIDIWLNGSGADATNERAENDIKH